MTTTRLVVAVAVFAVVAIVTAVSDSNRTVAADNETKTVMTMSTPSLKPHHHHRPLTKFFIDIIGRGEQEEIDLYSVDQDEADIKLNIQGSARYRLPDFVYAITTEQMRHDNHWLGDASVLDPLCQLDNAVAYNVSSDCSRKFLEAIILYNNKWMSMYMLPTNRNETCAFAMGRLVRLPDKYSIASVHDNITLWHGEDAEHAFIALMVDDFIVLHLNLEEELGYERIIHDNDGKEHHKFRARIIHHLCCGKDGHMIDGDRYRCDYVFQQQAEQPRAPLAKEPETRVERICIGEPFGTITAAVEGEAQRLSILVRERDARYTLDAAATVTRHVPLGLSQPTTLSPPLLNASTVWADNQRGDVSYTLEIDRSARVMRLTAVTADCRVKVYLMDGLRRANLLERQRLGSDVRQTFCGNVYSHNQGRIIDVVDAPSSPNEPTEDYSRANRRVILGNDDDDSSALTLCGRP